MEMNEKDQSYNIPGDNMEKILDEINGLKAENSALREALEGMNKAVCDLSIVFGKQQGKSQLLAAYKKSLDVLASVAVLDAPPEGEEDHD